ncbi:hypothetical protein T09_2221 [Trichinella sp. T9]|nr:hypothetical protein T09_2221 [Trichinella sp. T9]
MKKKKMMMKKAESQQNLQLTDQQAFISRPSDRCRAGSLTLKEHHLTGETESEGRKGTASKEMQIKCRQQKC